MQTLYILSFPITFVGIIILLVISNAKRRRNLAIACGLLLFASFVLPYLFSFVVISVAGSHPETTTHLLNIPIKAGLALAYIGGIIIAVLLYRSNNNTANTLANSAASATADLSLTNQTSNAVITTQTTTSTPHKLAKTGVWLMAIAVGLTILLFLPDIFSSDPTGLGGLVKIMAVLFFLGPVGIIGCLLAVIGSAVSRKHNNQATTSTDSRHASQSDTNN